jgi:hypothetical protein
LGLAGRMRTLQSAPNVEPVDPLTRVRYSLEA